MRRLLAVIAVAVVAALLVSGLRQASERSAEAGDAATFDLAAARERLAGAPAPLAALHERSNQLLDAGPRDFQRRLQALEGHPVVINKWASWCGPCRAEAPVLQDQAVAHGREIAFLGIDWRDSAADAREFMDANPFPFPSFSDPDGELADSLKLPRNIPVTLFLDERGKVAYLHQGGYRSAGDLAADIDRYLRG